MTFCYGVGLPKPIDWESKIMTSPMNFFLVSFEFVLFLILISTVVDEWFFFTFVCY